MIANTKFNHVPLCPIICSGHASYKCKYIVFSELIEDFNFSLTDFNPNLTAVC